MLGGLVRVDNIGVKRMLKGARRLRVFDEN